MSPSWGRRRRFIRVYSRAPAPSPPPVWAPPVPGRTWAPPWPPPPPPPPAR
ncbi:hypothetical protein JYU34_002956 [Plutella xylostella]|uniref:Uncharacterized protein n=1 Tax=Plutella xylostella TaxID=51655 RepID=A0ABQ7R3I4_PLUXY|nr:hypothetical protein JYU34_002956 [Plutella xylostella]